MHLFFPEAVLLSHRRLTGALRRAWSLKQGGNQGHFPLSSHVQFPRSYIRGAYFTSFLERSVKNPEVCFCRTEGLRTLHAEVLLQLILLAHIISTLNMLSEGHLTAIAIWHPCCVLRARLQAVRLAVPV